MATSVLREISKDEHERARLRSRKKYEMEITSNLLTAEARGEKRGEAKERKKWKPVIAEKNSKIVEQRAKIAEKDAIIAELQAQLKKSK